MWQTPCRQMCIRDRLKAADRRDVHFVIVGDGMSRDALEREIAAADVADWFTRCV